MTDREENKFNEIDKVMVAQSEIISELISTIRIQNKSIDTQNLIINRQRNDKELNNKFVKRLIVIVVLGIILSTCVTNCVFYYNYFNNNYVNEIKEANTTTTNYNENKIEKKIIENVNNERNDN